MMTTVEREAAVSRAFVDLADTLVSDFDMTDVMHTLVEHSVALLGADAAGLLLKDQRGGLHLIASSSHATGLLELFQIQVDEGPCRDCVRSGEPITVADLRDSTSWPQFAPAALDSGFMAVHAVPLRLRDTIVGALNLFTATPRALPNDDQIVARALADVATISLLQARIIRDSELVVEQLEEALTSRIIIEQAKGILAGRGNISPEQAFGHLRHRARSTNSRLTDIASSLVEGTLTVNELLGPTAPSPSTPTAKPGPPGGRH